MTCSPDAFAWEDEIQCVYGSCLVVPATKLDNEVVLNCVNAEIEHRRCIGELSCDEYDEFTDGLGQAYPCRSTYERETASCAELRQRLTGTAAAGGFACGDGQIIPTDWVCDLESDCNDGRDEANCAESGMGNVGAGGATGESAEANLQPPDEEETETSAAVPGPSGWCYPGFGPAANIHDITTFRGQLILATSAGLQTLVYQGYNDGWLLANDTLPILPQEMVVNDLVVDGDRLFILTEKGVLNSGWSKHGKAFRPSRCSNCV